ncbi:MAG: 2-amino-4-hydroxy-6-hydroxymethyldihydropteridine diphosphokinase [Acidiferrobacterales bacterium]
MNPAEPARAYIGLGSNLQDPAAQVRAAIVLLGQLPGTRVELCSTLYRSAPVGPVAQPDFVNAVCRLATGLEPVQLMHHLLALEAGRGRLRNVAGGPRVLDLDLLVYVRPDGSQAACSGPELVLPHPRLHERAFVLYPLSEIAPDLSIAGQGPVAGLMAGCTGQSISRLTVADGDQENAGSFKRKS